MVIGISATFIQKLVEATALDPVDKRFRISLNLRQTMTVDDILSLINFPHLRQVGILQFIEAIATYIPAGSIYRKEVLLRYRTRCQIRQLPLEADDINPLACSGKNEAYIPELKDAMLDFLHQIDQTEEDFDDQLCIYFECDDLHEYFEALAAADNLPSFEELEIGAKCLYYHYISTIAQKEAADDAHNGRSGWANKVALGSAWVPLPHDATSASAPKRKRKRKSKKANAEVISDEAGFMRDASISREVASAVAVGDVGRMWEGMKVMFFNFTGSGHNKYSGYLLEMVADLELESSPALRNSQLDTTICNPSAQEGG
ncbi:hypothetical protein B0H13DRAFT_1936760, partial [Mycena leptocephala]